MAVTINRDREAIREYLTRFDIDPNTALEDGISERGYFSRTDTLTPTAQDYREFHTWPEGFDWSHFDSLVNPLLTTQEDYPREWTRSEIRQLIVELMLEIEIEKLKGKQE